MAKRLYPSKSILFKQDTELKLIATYNYDLSDWDDTANLYSLWHLKIENRTLKTQEFVTYTCSVLINVITDNEDVEFVPQSCFGNYATLIRLKPRQQLEIPIITSIKKQASNRIVKFGYVILHPDKITNEGAGRQLDKMRDRQESVIWSEPIDLNLVSIETFKIEDMITNELSQ